MNGSRMVTQETWAWEAFSGHFSDLCFFFRLVFKESNFSEFMSSAYQTVYFKESTTLQKSILVGFCLLPLSFRSFHLALSYLYHYFEIFGA